MSLELKVSMSYDKSCDFARFGSRNGGGVHLGSLVSSPVSASDPSSSHIDWIVNDPQLICSVFRETMPIY